MSTDSAARARKAPASRARASRRSGISGYFFSLAHLGERAGGDGPATRQTINRRVGRVWRLLGPGLITGASDDDPSGIGTYSQAGAQLGYTMGWTMLVAYPLMVGIQEISARLRRTDGVWHRRQPAAVSSGMAAAGHRGPASRCQ